MFHKIKLQKFKKFSDTSFEVHPTGLSLLAGGNNSGKSTLLQSLAIWDFCCTVLRNEKGETSLQPGYTGQGVGVSDDEFSAIAIPGLNHMWTNLTNQIQGADGYSLSIRPYWKDLGGVERYLEISLALANDRLFIKPTASNLTAETNIPRVAFVPPFAGITAKEQYLGIAQRRFMIGSGLVGGVIRNLIHDLELANRKERANLKGAKPKISDSDLKTLREEDPWEQLQSALGRYFQTTLSVDPFNSVYHTYIRVNLVKGTWEKTRIKKFPKFKPRDLMGEGSGFLQWLSVFVLALDKQFDVVLLDEPDAHLHSSMQTLLVSELEKIARRKGNQIFLATHSTEILRWAEHSKIMRFDENKAKYLGSEDGKIGLFAGLGSEFSPRLDKLRRSKKMLIVEGESDYKILSNLAKCLGDPIDSEIVAWYWTGSSKERKQLFYQLKREIPDIKAVSIRDRDDTDKNLVDESTLRDKTVDDPSGDGLKLRLWPRRHIENYLMHPAAIARASHADEADVRGLLADQGIAITENFTATDAPQALKDARGKEILETSGNSIEKKFGANKFDISQSMLAEEIPEDIKTLLKHLKDLGAP
ncbi:ATP-dependent nuclease [Pseudooceanicola nitratireducens]|uniref:ATP-dependent nuclease n=1 Tax=Pseudooceanicola nitratireducens TaxID=517719 RepID=UPI001C9725F7|nr:AAA family ATPase [Pseudooceanicola nitratireducens]MBY6156043.1 AAA family ATPase [Pseudooceanicola nitratireducens]